MKTEAWTEWPRHIFYGLKYHDLWLHVKSCNFRQLVSKAVKCQNCCYHQAALVHPPQRPEPNCLPLTVSSSSSLEQKWKMRLRMSHNAMLIDFPPHGRKLQEWTKPILPNLPPSSFKAICVEQREVDRREIEVEAVWEVCSSPAKNMRSRKKTLLFISPLINARLSSSCSEKLNNLSKVSQSVVLYDDTRCSLKTEIIP